LIDPALQRGGIEIPDDDQGRVIGSIEGGVKGQDLLEAGGVEFRDVSNGWALVRMLEERLLLDEFAKLAVGLR
jgi:hypothetical protein